MTEKQKTDRNAPDPLLGKRLGDYTIQALVGEGGMARVYEGFDAKLGRLAAIKVIEVRHDGDDETTQRFIREARAIANLDHPNIVSVYQFGEAPNLYYLAMKLIEGKPLSSILRSLRKQKRNMPNDQLLKIITEIGSALDYAHSRGLIHRDIKPSNIMLTPDGRAILMDFGLTMERSSDQTLGTAFGTPRYIAPEQAIASHKSVPQSDIYSLGVVLYEMVTGRTPFDDESPMTMALAHISTPPPNPQTIRPDVSLAVQTVVLKALQKRPEDRWQTGQEMALALRKAYAGIEPGVQLSNAQLPEAEDFVHVATKAPKKPQTVKRKTGTASKNNQLLPAVIPENTMLDLKAVEPLGKKSSMKAGTSANARRRSWPRLLLFALNLVALAILVLVIYFTRFAGGNSGINFSGSGNTSINESSVRLIFDFNALTIYNPTTETVSLQSLEFKRDDNFTQPFNADQFGDRTHRQFAGQSCLRLRTQNADDSNTPFMCKTLVKSLAWNAPFWLMRNNDPVATFSVLLNGQVIKTCSMRVNTCEFSLGTLTAQSPPAQTSLP